MNSTDTYCILEKRYQELPQKDKDEVDRLFQEILNIITPHMSTNTHMDGQDNTEPEDDCIVLENGEKTDER